MGFEELTLQWLIVLTDDSRNIEPFEYAIGDLLIKWLELLFNDLSYTSLSETSSSFECVLAVHFVKFYLILKYYFLFLN